MTAIEHFLAMAESNSLELTHLIAFSKENNMSVVGASEFLSYHVAKSYADGALKYIECDRIMNSLFLLATTEQFWEFSDQSVPPLVMSVFLAFDEGEYLHRGDPLDVDPEDKYTRPMIQALLAQLELTPNPAFQRTAFGSR